MKTFKQHYTYTQFNNIINEQLNSTSGEDVIVENISNIFINEMIGTPIEFLSRFDGSEVSNMISDPEFVGKSIGPLVEWPNPLEWLAGAGLSVIAVKAIAKIIEKMVDNSNKAVDKARSISDADGSNEFNNKVQDAIAMGDALTDDEKAQLAKGIADRLNKKYPSRNRAWWLKALNGIVKFLKGKGGVGLALIGYILI